MKYTALAISTVLLLSVVGIAHGQMFYPVPKQDPVLGTTPAATVKYPPIAWAGHPAPDQSVKSNQTVTLDASGSYVRNLNDTIIRFFWTQTRGPAVQLSNNSEGPKVSFKAPIVNTDTLLRFRLGVMDRYSLVDYDYTSIIVSPSSTPNPTPVPTPTPTPTPGPGTGQWSFATAGDFGSDANAVATATNIAKAKVPLVIGLGDYCYCGSDSGWWTKVVTPLNGITFRGAPGNHEYEDSHGAVDLLKAIGQANWNYNFDYKNIHFVLIDEDGQLPSPAVLNSDLAAARANPNIKWIVMAFHEPIYTSKSDHAPDENGIKSLVLPVIDKYHVDLVLQGHNHNYQRTFPMKNDKVDPTGSTYLVVGTGGQDLYNLNNQASYVTKQFTGIHGFLKVDVTDNTLQGTFFANDGSVKDSFTISK